jgi:general secretion pathway protein D
MKTNWNACKYVALWVLVATLTGCAADRFHREGISLIQEGRIEEGLGKLSQAMQADPGNGGFRKDWLMQRDALANRLMEDGNRERVAEHWDAALQRYARVLVLDRGHIGARQATAEIALERRQNSRLDEAALMLGKGDAEGANNLVTRVLVENPAHIRALQLRGQIVEATQSMNVNPVSLNLKGRKPVTLQFRDANLRMVMEAIARTTGLNVLFDKDVKSDLKVTIFVRETPVEEAIDLILMQTQTAKRVMGENSMLIYPDTETKAREYADLKIRRFAITNADPKNVMAMVKTMTKTKDMFVDEKTNALVIRDTPQVIRIIEKLVASMDQAEPEVMLEVDVMEVSRDRMLALGVDLPTSFGVSIPSMTLDKFKLLGDADATVSAMGASIQAKKTDSDINDLATPRIRVRNKEKAKFLVGDRLPVISTAAVPTSTTTSAVYNTNVQYVEVGIKIEVEPTIYADGEVAIRLTLEVSSNSGQNPDAAKNGTIAYTISTRSVSTVLRLKDGQTEVIGGLIQDQDRSGAIRIPGVGDIPILGRLFGVQTDTKNKKEIIMSITPRIVRSNKLVDNELLEMWSGTENNMRFGTRQVGNPRMAGAVPVPSVTPAVVSGAASTELSPAAAPAVNPANTASVPAARPAAGAVLSRAAALANAANGGGAASGNARAPAVVPAQPVSIVGPGSARPGEKITVAVAFPPVVPATALETSLSYDASRLKVLSVNEGDASRNASRSLRFAGDQDSPGSVHLELVAGRGEALPSSGGALAQVQFEVLPGSGPTEVGLGDARLLTVDQGSVSLPVLPALSVDVKAAP